MELRVLDEKTMREYTDDEELIEKLDMRLRWFSVVENMADLVSYPMEYFIDIPYITVEECQLIDEVQRKENIKIREWAQKPENAELIKSSRNFDRLCEHFADEYKKELENEERKPEYC